MGRPVTLFTGQWADLPLEELAAKARAWGFDGLELATWGDHFEVDRALADPAYVGRRRPRGRAPAGGTARGGRRPGRRRVRGAARDRLHGQQRLEPALLVPAQ